MTALRSPRDVVTAIMLISDGGDAMVKATDCSWPWTSMGGYANGMDANWVEAIGTEAPE